jgi:hypothetical protein
MNKSSRAGLLISAIAVAACASASDPEPAPDRTVEIVLREHLPDEDRGWCIDAAGHQQNAIMEGGVHAHTCYSYENKGIAVDQGFSEQAIEQGSFRLVKFDHCLTMAIDKPDSWIALTPCDGRAEQKFEMTNDGRIEAMASSKLCITLGPDTVFGGGGNPIHQIRAATLDTCSDDKMIFQKWRVRDHKDW